MSIHTSVHADSTGAAVGGKVNKEAAVKRGMKNKVARTEKRAVLDQNSEKVWPSGEKVVQGRSDENCVALSIAAALASCREVSGGKDAGLDVAFERAIAECRERFHDVVLPMCKGGKYSSRTGYSQKCVMFFVRHLGKEFFEGKGYELGFKSYRTWTHRTFLKMSRGQRKGRRFVLFGHYPSSGKNAVLQKRLAKDLSSWKTAKKIFEPLPASFWLPAKEFQLHAICITYDAEGRGTIDDPAHRAYHPVTPAHFFRSCACISSVYEVSVRVATK